MTQTTIFFYIKFCRCNKKPKNLCKLRHFNIWSLNFISSGTFLMHPSLIYMVLFFLLLHYQNYMDDGEIMAANQLWIHQILGFGDRRLEEIYAKGLCDEDGTVLAKVEKLLVNIKVDLESNLHSCPRSMVSTKTYQSSAVSVLSVEYTTCYTKKTKSLLPKVLCIWNFNSKWIQLIITGK